VLIDSEVIAYRVYAECLNEAGIMLSIVLWRVLSSIHEPVEQFRHPDGGALRDVLMFVTF
jgi:hypothetical protein